MKSKHFSTALIALLLFIGPCDYLWAAGNVMTLFDKGNLLIVGDQDSNNIHVNGDLETLYLTIEGDLSETIPLVDVGHISIITGGGRDFITVQGTVLGSVEISSGQENDWVGVLAAIMGDLSIESGHGHDRIYVDYSTKIENALKVISGHGADQITFGGCDVGGDLSVNTGGNDDDVRVEFAVNVRGDLEMQFGQGDDFLRLGYPYGTSRPLFVVGGSAWFHGDQGANRLELNAGPLTLDDVIMADEGFEVIDFVVFDF